MRGIRYFISFDLRLLYADFFVYGECDRELDEDMMGGLLRFFPQKMRTFCDRVDLCKPAKMRTDCAMREFLKKDLRRRNHANL